MNIDDLKGSYKSLSYGDEGPGTGEFKRKIENTLDEIRNEDRKTRFKLIAAVILIVAFVMINGSKGILRYMENPEGTGFVGYFLYVLALLGMLPFIIRKFLRFSHIDYDVPVIRFIENAEKRYSLFHWDQLSLIPFLVILDFSVIYMLAKDNTPSIHTIIASQIVIIIAITIGLLVALIFWYRKLYILNELRRIKESLK